MNMPYPQQKIGNATVTIFNVGHSRFDLAWDLALTEDALLIATHTDGFGRLKKHQTGLGETNYEH